MYGRHMIGIIRLKYGAGSCILPNKQVVWHYLVFIIKEWFYEIVDRSSHSGVSPDCMEGVASSCESGLSDIYVN